MTCWQHIHIKNFMNPPSVPVVTGRKGERDKYFFLYSIKLNLRLSFSNHLFFFSRVIDDIEKFQCTRNYCLSKYYTWPKLLIWEWAAKYLSLSKCLDISKDLFTGEEIPSMTAWMCWLNLQQIQFHTICWWWYRHFCLLVLFFTVKHLRRLKINNKRTRDSFKKRQQANTQIKDYGTIK